MWNHCCLSTHSVYTIQPRTTFTVSLYLKPHTCVHVCLAVTCHMHFGSMIMIFQVLLQWHMGETDTEIRVSTESWPWGRKLSCHFCWDWKPGLFDHESVLYTELSPNSKITSKQKYCFRYLRSNSLVRLKVTHCNGCENVQHDRFGYITEGQRPPKGLGTDCRSNLTPSTVHPCKHETHTPQVKK